jgi:hypothetical protein
MMLSDRLLIEQDRFRPPLERTQRPAVLGSRCAMLAWAVSAILSHACATVVMPSGTLSRDVAPEIAITISNGMSRAMRIFLYAESVELPLGTVPALATRTFLVPGGFTNGASENQIEARHRGAEVGLRTERFALGPGGVVAVTLSRANSATVTVRPRPTLSLPRGALGSAEIQSARFGVQNAYNAVAPFRPSFLQLRVALTAYFSSRSSTSTTSAWAAPTCSVQSQSTPSSRFVYSPRPKRARRSGRTTRVA